MSSGRPPTLFLGSPGEGRAQNPKGDLLKIADSKPLVGKRLNLRHITGDVTPPTRGKAKLNLAQARDEVPLVAVESANPWKSYTRCYNKRLDQTVTVCSKTLVENEVFDIRMVPELGKDGKIDRLCRLRHEKILQLYRILKSEASFYTVSEHMEHTLLDVINSRLELTHIHLAAIFFQILEAKSFLESEKVTTTLTCKNIVFSKMGNVKIASSEFFICKEDPVGSKDLGRMIILSMEKEKPNNDTFELRNPYWSKAAIEFLSSTEFQSTAQLQKHLFLKEAPGGGVLMTLVQFVAATVYQKIYLYPHTDLIAVGDLLLPTMRRLERFFEEI